MPTQMGSQIYTRTLESLNWALSPPGQDNYLLIINENSFAAGRIMTAGQIRT